MSGRVDFGCGGVWAARHGRFGQEDWGQKDLVERTAFRICIGMGIAARGRDEYHHHHHHLGYPISSGSSVLSFLFGSLGSSFVHPLHQRFPRLGRSSGLGSIKQADRVHRPSATGLVVCVCVCVCAHIARPLPAGLLRLPTIHSSTYHFHTDTIPTVPSQHRYSLPTPQEARSSTDRLARQDKITSTGWDTRDSNGVARTRTDMDGWIKMDLDMDACMGGTDNGRGTAPCTGAGAGGNQHQH